jgi:hypothetical protein
MLFNKFYPKGDVFVMTMSSGMEVPWLQRGEWSSSSSVALRSTGTGRWNEWQSIGVREE